MPTIYKGQTFYDLEEMRSMLKESNRKRADEIPTLLRQKQAEYV